MNMHLEDLKVNYGFDTIFALENMNIQHREQVVVRQLVEIVSQMVT